jgi:hypothetical protein
MESEKLAVLTNLQMISIAYLLLHESPPGQSLGDTYVTKDMDSNWYLVNLEYHSNLTGKIVTITIDQYGLEKP